MSKILMETEGRQMTSEYGAHASHAVKARLHACTRMHTPTRPGTHTHSRIPINNTYRFSKATIIRESASMLRYCLSAQFSAR
jgi:hypothetical protein